MGGSYISRSSFGYLLSVKVIASAPSLFSSSICKRAFSLDSELFRASIDSRLKPADSSARVLAANIDEGEPNFSIRTPAVLEPTPTIKLSAIQSTSGLFLSDDIREVQRAQQTLLN